MNLHMNKQHICLSTGSKLLLSSPLGSTAIELSQKFGSKVLLTSQLLVVY